MKTARCYIVVFAFKRLQVLVFLRELIFDFDLILHLHCMIVTGRLLLGLNSLRPNLNHRLLLSNRGCCHLYSLSVCYPQIGIRLVLVRLPFSFNVGLLIVEKGFVHG